MAYSVSQETMHLEYSPLLGPSHELIVVSTLSLETPTQKSDLRSLRRLERGVG